jgi:hypothetical protein
MIQVHSCLFICEIRCLRAFVCVCVCVCVNVWVWVGVCVTLAVRWSECSFVLFVLPPLSVSSYIPSCFHLFARHGVTGFLDVLGQLTSVGDVTREAFDREYSLCRFFCVCVC